MIPRSGLYRPMVDKTQQEIQRHFLEMQSRYHFLYVLLYWQRSYKEANIAWGKYKAYQEAMYSLFPFDGDKGLYTFPYLFSKLDVRISELENERNAKFAKGAE